MADPEHFAVLKQSVEAWNGWRAANPGIDPDLSGANLWGTNLSNANLSNANLRKAKLSGADLWEASLWGAKLSGADLWGANLCRANLGKANLRVANLEGADLRVANLREAKLSMASLKGANLSNANLRKANLRKANLHGANLWEANLREANLSGAILWGANLSGANLRKANLSGADLRYADLSTAILVKTNLARADLTGCHIYGISVWDPKLEETKQRDLVITQRDESVITVDNLEVAQFTYLLLHNEKIRNIIDTITSKAVLILGRFTPERKAILNALRDKLRKLNYLPMMFDFEKPTDKDFTETIMTLAGMCRFIIADITNPSSSPLELQATVPNYMIPFVPIIQEGEKPFAMFNDLYRKYDWVLTALIYPNKDRLVEKLEEAIVEPALKKHQELAMRKVAELPTRSI